MWSGDGRGRIWRELLGGSRDGRASGFMRAASASSMLTLERDQLRRLQSLQPELDFDSSIAEKNALRDSLARQIQEEVQEVHAEIAELAAAEENPAERGALANGQ
ncbi:hypothetical protein RTBOTA2_002492 [Rhodotorula toruloides]|nr:hypothetical protein RTBOTA2_002492 [Rhodotorula toruloides]